VANPHQQLADKLTAEIKLANPSLVAHAHAASRPTIVPIPADTDGTSLAAGALTRTTPLVAHWSTALHDVADQLLDAVELGRLNQQFVDAADHAYLLIAGRALRLDPIHALPGTSGPPRRVTPP
jgi:hypothetical protein